MLCAAPLGKSPLLPPSFYNLAIDERFEAVFNPTASERTFRIELGRWMCRRLTGQ